MTFSLIATLTHPDWDEPIEHVDMLEARSKSAVIKTLGFDNRKICELRNTGKTSWKDHRGVRHTISLNHESD